MRDLARDFTPFDNPDIRFVAWCSQEFDTADEYREALEEGKLEKPIHIPLHDSTSGKEQTMSNEHQESKKTVLYKGIALEDLDKHVSMAHSRFIGTNEGVDYLTALFARDMKTLTSEQFEEMSALSSVGNMNYQICNGGLSQYYFNAMDEERAPFSDQDVAHLDKDAQVEMMRTLLEFGREVYPEREEDNEKLAVITQAFDRSYYDVTSEEDFDEGCVFHDTVIHARPDFDERYYEVNEHLETLMEAYAQFLDKSIEKELARDGKETFYFSFGTSDTFPFKLGWVEVRATDRMEACEMYSSHYPKRDGIFINCAFVYDANEWKQAGMDEGKPDQVCHRVITDWGPYANEEKPLDELVSEAKEKAAEKNANRCGQRESRDFKGIDR